MMNISQRKLRDLSLLLIALGIVAAGFWFILPTSNTRLKLTITAGSALGRRHAIALELKQICRRHQIELAVIATEGSDDALHQLDQGLIDLALVQGGLINADYPQVRQVAPLHKEPLHLLVKPQVARKIASEGLLALANCRINVGSQGSGTMAVSTALLEFLGLHDDSMQTGLNKSRMAADLQVRLQHLTYDQVLALDNVEQLPDAAFSISSLPSPFAKEMVDRFAYELIPLPFPEAFALDALDSVGQMNRSNVGEVGTHGRFDQSKVYPATIPAYTYSVRHNQPPKTLETISTRLLLVANKSVASSSVERILKVLFESSITKDAHPPLDLSVMDLAPEFPWHPGATLFTAHHQPLVAGDFMELTANGLAIAGSMCGGVFFLVQWLRRRRQSNCEAEFRIYLNKVHAIELNLVEIDAHGPIPVYRLLALNEELVSLKNEVAQRFFRGELDGQAMMLGFMTLSNDVRNHITRLLLRERDNVEELADKQEQCAETLWNQRARNESRQTTLHVK